MFKEADWRYRDAMAFIAGGDPYHRPPDGLARKLAQHLKSVMGKVKYHSHSEQRANKWVRLAYQLKCDACQQSPRWAVEALALGGETPLEIAVDTGLEQEVVKTYLDCFFDMRDNAIKMRYINNMGSYTCAYDHTMLPSIGFKYIVAHFGLEFFKKFLYSRHTLTRNEMMLISQDSRNCRHMRSWSKSWESLNPSAVVDKTDIEELGVMVKEDLAEKDMNRKEDNANKKNNADKGEDTLKEVWKYIRIGMASAPEKGLGAREERLIKN